MGDIGHFVAARKQVLYHFHKRNQRRNTHVERRGKLVTGSVGSESAVYRYIDVVFAGVRGQISIQEAKQFRGFQAYPCPYLHSLVRFQNYVIEALARRSDKRTVQIQAELYAVQYYPVLRKVLQLEIYIYRGIIPLDRKKRNPTTSMFVFINAVAVENLLYK